jgi:chromosome segregation ATPase
MIGWAVAAASVLAVVFAWIKLGREIDSLENQLSSAKFWRDHWKSSYDGLDAQWWEAALAARDGRQRIAELEAKVAELEPELGRLRREYGINLQASADLISSAHEFGLKVDYYEPDTKPRYIFVKAGKKARG